MRKTWQNHEWQDHSKILQDLTKILQEHAGFLFKKVLVRSWKNLGKTLVRSWQEILQDSCHDCQPGHWQIDFVLNCFTLSPPPPPSPPSQTISMEFFHPSHFFCNCNALKESICRQPIECFVMILWTQRSLISTIKIHKIKSCLGIFVSTIATEAPKQVKLGNDYFFARKIMVKWDLIGQKWEWH